MACLVSKKSLPPVSGAWGICIASCPVPVVTIDVDRSGEAKILGSREAPLPQTSAGLAKLGIDFV